jgi:2-hydroxychromene-2-carboxylate isomerase
VQIPFYFDYACPWAFFASSRAEAYFADQGVEIDFVPVRLRKLAEPSPDGSSAGPAKMGPRKQENYIADLLRWAAFCGVEIAPNARDHLRVDTAPALRVALAAKELSESAEAFRRLHHSIYRARWCEGLDVTQAELLAKLIEAAGLEADAVQARAESDACVEALDRQTADAIERGVFGVPTLFVDDQMFWGNDRFELVRHYIATARRGAIANARRGAIANTRRGAGS